MAKHFPHNVQMTMHVPREVLQMLFLIAGPSSFGIFRLVCKQWKRVVDSEEFKVILTQNPRCFVPERQSYSRFLGSGIGGAQKEHLQFVPQTFSLFFNESKADAIEVFDMGFWNLDPPGFYNQIAMQKGNYEEVSMTRIPNTVAIEIDNRKCWEKSMPDLQIKKIKENEHPDPWKIMHIMKKEKWNQDDEGIKREGEEIKKKWEKAKATMLLPPREPTWTGYVSGGL